MELILTLQVYLLILSAISNSKVTKFLIKNEANVKAQNNEALIRAVEGSHDKVVKALVAHGADVQAQKIKAYLIHLCLIS